MNNLIGQHLGPYRILEQIGLGGMAAVYKAYQPAMERDVAIKVIASHFAQEEEFLRRFRREARAVAQLEHAHILPVHDYGEAEGRPYLVMRYLEAGTLKERMAQEPLSLSEINRVVGQVGSALDYAHRMGVIHRDVKPANVLMDAEGDAFLTDFGLAKMMSGSAKLTGTGVGIGTPVYMSPEQGQAQKVDARSDVYSLGVMLYELVTGRAPYEAETPLAVVLKHIQEPLPLPSSVRADLPERVERVILRAMAKQPDDRYQTAGEMVRALDGAVRAAEAAARTEPAIERTTPMPGVVRAAPRAPARRLRLPRWAGWAVGGAVGLAAFFLILSRAPLRVQISGGQLEVVRVVEGTVAATLTPIPTEQEGAAPVAATPAPGSPADQARAFAEPILAAVADRPPDYEDDFSDPASGWPIGSSDGGDEWGYEEGQYFISATPSAQGCIGASPDHALWFSDFVLEVDAQFVSGEWGAWNVLFRDSPGTLEQPASAHYGVDFDPSGALNLWKNVSGVHINLVEGPVYAPTFEQGFDTNRLTIIAQGPQIAVYVNGEPLWFVYDESSSKGKVYPGVCNSADTPLRVHFDNFKVWDITDLPLPSAEATPAPAGECRIAYGQDGDIYVRNCDGSGVRRLTSHPSEDAWPSWSPDGQRIVFYSDRERRPMPDANFLYIVDADGANLTRLTFGDDNDLFPDWSPDGSRIAFHRSCSLAVIDPDGSDPWVWESDKVCVDNPMWSPDGQQLAFTSWLRDVAVPVSTVYVINTDGTGLLELARFHGGDTIAVWSSDGKQIGVEFYDEDETPQYYLLTAAGSGEPVEVESIPDSWYPWHWPQWGGEEAITAAQPLPSAQEHADRAAEYVARAHWDEAIAEITRAIELDPTNPQYYITRAFLYDAGKGMMEEAVADATQAIELAPALYDAWAERGAVYLHMQECALAVADHNEAISLDSNRFDGYVHRADALRCQGELDAAIADYDRAITIDPTSAWAFWNRGMTYEQKGDLDAAIADYSQAIALEPNDLWASPDWYYSRAGAYRALGQHEQALADCDAALALVADDPRGFYCRGLSEVALGQTDEARADFEQAVSLAPISAWSAWVTDAAQAELDKMGP